MKLKDLILKLERYGNDNNVMEEDIKVNYNEMCIDDNESYDCDFDLIKDYEGNIALRYTIH